MIEISGIHYVNGHSMRLPPQDGMSYLVLGMGCFWGAERLFWGISGVYSTAVGYADGHLEYPNYQQVCSGSSGHAEVVLIIYDAKQVTLEQLLKVFWENHDPTQGMRQGNDIGSQYRSILLYHDDEQQALMMDAKRRFQASLTDKGYGPITTEISQLGTFYYAEEYHQQYLAKNPNGYCGLAATGACLI